MDPTHNAPAGAPLDPAQLAAIVAALMPTVCIGVPK